MTTRAIQLLKQNHISFEVIRYKHDQKGAQFAAKAIDFPLEKTIKTLAVELPSNVYRLALVPGNGRLSVKRFSQACGVKRTALCSSATAERLTGYKIGGISPFGTRRVIPIVADASIFKFAKIAINGGQRGIMLIIDPDVVRCLFNPLIADISESPRR